MTRKPGVVYGLVDPLTKKVMYIGQTIKSVEARLATHLSKSSLQEDCPKNDWLKGLLANGLKPNIIILEEAAGWELVDAENKWIEIFSTKPNKVTNRYPMTASCYKYPEPKKQTLKPLKSTVSERSLLKLERQKEAVKKYLAS